MTRIHMNRPSASASAAADFNHLLRQEVSKKTASAVEQIDQMAKAAAALLARRQILSPTQKRFVESEATRKAASCTRRAGKTFGCVQLILEAVCAHPWADPNKSQPVVQVIGTTVKDVKRLFWEPLKAVARQVGLVGVWDDHAGVADFPNGCTVRLGGASDKESIDGYRGSSYVLVVIDEAASFGPKMETLVMESISMALTDYNGTIAMVGSPGKVRVGMFYEVATGQRAAEGWVVFEWSYFENDSLDAEVRTVEWIIRTQGPLDSPKVRRECFGEWVADGASLVYKFNPATGYFDGKLPANHDWRYVLGIDLGYIDDTAFSIIAHSPTSPYMYLVHAESAPHMLPTQIAERIVELRNKYNFKRIVCDGAGATTKGNMIEWNRRYGFGMTAVQKQNKVEYIEHMNSDFYQGKLKVYPGCPVVKDWEQLIWNDDPNSVRQDGTPTEHKGFANHLADATLYAFRESMHFRGREPTPMPEIGTQAYLNKFESDARLKYLKSAKQRQTRSLWK